MSNKLKEILIQRQIKQIELAYETGIHDSRISKIANNWVMPTAKEKQKICEFLDESENAVFPEEESNFKDKVSNAKQRLSQIEK